MVNPRAAGERVPAVVVLVLALLAALSLSAPLALAQGEDGESPDQSGLSQLAELGCSAVGAANAAIGAACEVVGPVTDAASGAVSETAAGAVASAAGDAFGKIVQSAQEALAQAFEWSITFWLKLPTNLFGSTELAERVTSHLNSVLWYALTASLMVAAVRLTQARMQGDGSEELFMLHLRVVIANSSLAAFIAAAARAGDAFSDWILTESAGPDGPEAVKNLLAVDAFNELAGFFVLLVAIIGILGAAMQMIFVVMREVVLLFAVAGLPIAAAASGMAAGTSSWDRLLKWTIAFLLFKPIGALLYAIAFWAGNDAQDPMQVFLSLIALVMVAGVLPMLIKLVAPAATAVGAGMSGMAAAGMVGGMAVKAGAAAATGGASAAAGGAAGGAQVAAGAGGQMSGGLGQGFGQQGQMTPAHSGGAPAGPSGAEKAAMPSSGPSGAESGAGGTSSGGAGEPSMPSGGPRGASGGGAAGAGGAGDLGPAVTTAGTNDQSPLSRLDDLSQMNPTMGAAEVPR